MYKRVKNLAPNFDDQKVNISMVMSLKKICTFLTISYEFLQFSLFFAPEAMLAGQGGKGGKKYGIKVITIQLSPHLSSTIHSRVGWVHILYGNTAPEISHL